MTEKSSAGLGDTASRDKLDEVHVPDDDRAGPFMMQFAAVAIVIALGVAGFYATVDPHDKFPSDIYRPLIVDWTESKLNLLDRQDEMPATVILGSSRAMALEPKYIAQTGLGPAPAFSLAIPSSTSKDHKLLYDFFVARDAAPDVMVVTLDMDVRAEVPSVAQGSAAYARLTGRTPDIIDRVSQVGKAFSVGGIVDTGRVLYFNHVAAYPAERMVLLEDGATDFPFIAERRAAGTFNLESAIDAHLAAQVRPYYATEEPSMVALGYIEDLAHAASANGTRLHVIVPPVHPLLAERLAVEVAWLAQHEEAVVDRLKGTCSSSVTIYDFRELETFGGDPEDFFDGWNYMEKNGRLLVDAMIEGTGSIC